MSRPIRRVPRDASLVPSDGLNANSRTGANQFIPNQFVPGQLDPRDDPRFASNPALAQALATRQPLTPSQIQSLSQLLTPAQLQAVTRIISRSDPTRTARSQTSLQNQTILQRLTNLETGLANLATQLDRLNNIECRLAKLEECFTRYPTSYGTYIGTSIPSYASPCCPAPCSVPQPCCDQPTSSCGCSKQSH